MSESDEKLTGKRNIINESDTEDGQSMMNVGNNLNADIQQQTTQEEQKKSSKQ